MVGGRGGAWGCLVGEKSKSKKEEKRKEKGEHFKVSPVPTHDCPKPYLKQNFKIWNK